MNVLAVVSLAILAMFHTVNGVIFVVWFTAATLQPGAWSVRFLWEPRDLWVGIYYHPEVNRLRVYVCPVPAVCFRFTRDVLPLDGEPGEAWLEMLESLPDRSEVPARPEVSAVTGLEYRVPGFPAPYRTPTVPDRKAPTPLPPPTPPKLYEE